MGSRGSPPILRTEVPATTRVQIMSIDFDPKPLTISYDKNKDKYTVLRRANALAHLDTKKEALQWIADRDMQLRVVRFFYNRLPPTVNPIPKTKVVARW